MSPCSSELRERGPGGVHSLTPRKGRTDRVQRDSTFPLLLDETGCLSMCIEISMVHHATLTKESKPTRSWMRLREGTTYLPDSWRVDVRLGCCSAVQVPSSSCSQELWITKALILVTRSFACCVAMSRHVQRKTGAVLVEQACRTIVKCLIYNLALKS